MFTCNRRPGPCDAKMWNEQQGRSSARASDIGRKWSPSGKGAVGFFQSPYSLDKTGKPIRVLECLFDLIERDSGVPPPLMMDTWGLFCHLLLFGYGFFRVLRGCCWETFHMFGFLWFSG